MPASAVELTRLSVRLEMCHQDLHRRPGTFNDPQLGQQRGLPGRRLRERHTGRLESFELRRRRLRHPQTRHQHREATFREIQHQRQIRQDQQRPGNLGAYRTPHPRQDV